jgi:hypothetical protein
MVKKNEGWFVTDYVMQVGEYNIRSGHTSRIILKYKRYDRPTTIVKINSETGKMLTEVAFHYNQHMVENGAILVSKYYGLRK